MTHTHSLKETVPPGAEPVSLAMAKAHMRIDHDADDTALISLIALARSVCEDYTGRALIARGYSLYLDTWPSNAERLAWWDGVRDGADVAGHARSLSLPRAPLLSVSGIHLFGADDTETVYAPSYYMTDTARTPGRIILKDAAPAPVAGRIAMGIEIRFRAGYGNAAESVPMALRQGILQLIAHFYAHRGDDHNAALRVSGAAGLFQSYRIMTS